MLDLVDEVGDQPLEVLGSVLGGPQHLFVVCFLSAVIIGHNLVGDEGQAQDTQTTVASHHHLWDGAHAWAKKRRIISMPDGLLMLKRDSRSLCSVLLIWEVWWPWELTTSQGEKTHPKSQKGYKFSKQLHQFDNTSAAKCVAWLLMFYKVAVHWTLRATADKRQNTQGGK